MSPDRREPLACERGSLWTMIDGQVARSIVSLADPVGILTIYAGVAPEAAGTEPPSELELRHALEEAERGLDDERARALRSRLSELGDELDFLVSPRESGRGRVLFAGLSGGEPLRHAVRTSFPTVATVADCAVARPLLAALEAGRPAGLVHVSQDELRLHEWRPGETAELRAIPLLEPAEPRELLGPAASRPREAPYAGPGFRAGQQRDLYERRVAEERQRLLARIPDVHELADERRWDEVVVVGNEELARVLAEALRRNHGPEVLLEPRVLGWLSPAELAEAVEPMINEVRARRQVAQVERVTSEALAGGRGALGLADTLAALAEGRVELLLLPEDRELSGWRASNGTLYPPGPPPPWIGEEELREEPLLAERMIRQALDTDARIAFLSGEAETALGDNQVAALLRW